MRLTLFFGLWGIVQRSGATSSRLKGSSLQSCWLVSGKMFLPEAFALTGWRSQPDARECRFLVTKRQDVRLLRTRARGERGGEAPRRPIGRNASGETVRAVVRCGRRPRACVS